MNEGETTESGGGRPFFSIVAACCDVERYVRECFGSVTGQSFGDWEIVAFVEDSKDATERIVREIASGDPRIRVFTGPRTGSCSVPRNRGIEEARGEYVLFLDGDDTIAEGSLRLVHDGIAARPGADVYPCAMLVADEVRGGTLPTRDNYPPDFSGELSGPAATLMIYERSRDPCPMLQLSAFRREFLAANGLRCLPGRKRQDSEFAPRALYLARRVVPIHVPFYLYRIRANSVSMLAKKTDYFFDDYAEILKSLLAFHAKVSAEAGFDRRISRAWARHWLTWIFYRWFSPRAIRGTPRSRRRESLRAAFPDGFADFDALCRSATKARRAAAPFVKLFVASPSLGWLADAFFLRVYNPLVGMRDGLRGSSAEG